MYSRYPHKVAAHRKSLKPVFGGKSIHAMRITSRHWQPNLTNDEPLTPRPPSLAIPFYQRRTGNLIVSISSSPYVPKDDITFTSPRQPIDPERLECSGETALREHTLQHIF
jgi:hypothetical protein